MKQNISTGRRQRYFAKTQVLKIALSFLILLGILVLSSVVARGPAMAADTMINCDAHKGVCSQSSGALTVSLEITPRPVKAMQDLVFKVSITGASPAEPPHIDLGMPAMKMGPNQVALKPTGPGTYEGTGVVVRCPSGKRTWFANVIVPGSGEVKFIFDVIY
jgi:hypothetical protein